MKIKYFAQLAAALLLLGSMQANAVSVPIALTALTGDTFQSTGIVKANLSGLGLTQLASIKVVDDGGTSGSPGIWSGFDMAGIKLSTTDCLTAACADGLVGESVFDFVNNVLFTAGTMDATGAPLNGPCLAGTSGGGCTVDDSIATLGDFDATFNSGTGAHSGFLSLGRNGSIAFNLTMLVSLVDPIFLYIGEVGNNGEALIGAVEISDIPSAVPVPAAVWLFGTALLGFVGMSRRRKVA